MYELSTRRCAKLTREVRWIDTTVSKLPTFDGLNHLEEFFLDFEEIVQTQQRLFAMNEALKETPTRWWGDTQKQHYRLGTMSYFDDNIILSASRRLRS
jgi:hypothetical protein